MTARADVVARITDRVQFLTSFSPGELDHDKPLIGQARIDSLDLFDIELAIEDEFEVELDLTPASTIDSIADAVISARK